MSNIGKGPHLEQGEGGAHKQASSGSRMSQGKSGGAVRGASSGSKFDQNRNVTTHATGSKFEQHPSNKTGKHAPQSGGHSRTGHDHSNPTAGKSKSGSKFAQHPNVRK